MKTCFFKTIHCAAFILLSALVFSCTKENASLPARQQSSSTATDAVTADPGAPTAVTPGMYYMSTFIDSGTDNTDEFAGYTFNFNSDGTLVAETNTGDSFTGKWKENAAGTKMIIKITGTTALDDLNATDWNVIKITSKRISIDKKGPTKAIFAML